MDALHLQRGAFGYSPASAIGSTPTRLRPRRRIVPNPAVSEQTADMLTTGHILGGTGAVSTLPEGRLRAELEGPGEVRHSRSTPRRGRH
jgi:hypothetical protein